MDVGKFLCKIGLHKSEPVIAGEQSDDGEMRQTSEVIERREARCVRCGLVYTEVVNYYPHGEI